MIGVVGVEGLAISCIIGHHEKERRREREVIVDLKVEVDVSKCVANDRLDGAVNYVALADACAEVAKGGCYYLVESLAAAITDRIFEDFNVAWVWVKVTKPGAIALAKGATVELQRRHDERP